MPKEKADDCGGIPLHEVEKLARVLLPEMRRFFASEEGRRELAAWREKRAREADSNN